MVDLSLPNFLIIGAVRGGTTSLHHYIAQHPEVFMSREKELNYFCYEGQQHPSYRARTLEEYRLYFEAGKVVPVRGESSPNYLHSALARKRIARQLPDVRLLVSLRNPVDRTYSHWVNRSRFGLYNNFEDALERDPLIIEHSRYLEPLTAYQRQFGDRLKIVLFDDLQSDPLQTTREVFGFLGVDESFKPDFTRRLNRGRVPLFPRLNGFLLRIGFGLGAPLPLRVLYRAVRGLVEKRPAPMRKDTEKRLQGLFRKEILALQGVLGRDLSEWLK